MLASALGSHKQNNVLYFCVASSTQMEHEKLCGWFDGMSVESA